MKSAETSTECHMEDERAERLLVDSSVQTDPEAQLRAPASSPRVGDLSAHKVRICLALDPLIVCIFFYQRKGLSKALARDAIDAVFTDTPPQIPPANEHPSPAKQKRARIALKQEQDEDLALPEGMLAPAHPCVRFFLSRFFKTWLIDYPLTAREAWETRPGTSQSLADGKD